MKNNGVPIGTAELEEMEVHLKNGCTVTCIAIDKRFAGYVALSDTLRTESAHMVDQLKKTGVVPVLLTGDNNHAASSIAERLHIQEVYSGCLPEDKLAYIDQCESEHQPVCMVGDGVNDAPALKKAAVGIANGRYWQRHCRRRSRYCPGR